MNTIMNLLVSKMWVNLTSWIVSFGRRTLREGVDHVKGYFSGVKLPLHVELR
jgi:hypothetical protein